MDNVYILMVEECHEYWPLQVFANESDAIKEATRAEEEDTSGFKKFFIFTRPFHAGDES